MIEKTVWELRSYDVWGNAKEGYEVNDSFVTDREYEIDCPITLYNKGTEYEFAAACPTDRQIKTALDIKPRVHITTDGDDLHIYVEHKSKSYPLGELYCVSHESLSPIRVKSK